MIGKTRHNPEARKSPLPASLWQKASQTCGDLIKVPSAHWYRHARFAPPPALAGWIEHFWLERWAVRALGTETRELLPHPCVQWAFSPQGSRIYGVQQGRFVRTYQGEGRVFGMKFKTGAFFPFLRQPVSTLSNTSIAAARVLPTAVDVAAQIFGCATSAGMVATAAQFLMANLPPVDPQVEFISRVVETIAKDRELTRVQHLLSRFESTERSLQRLFHRYVGASPRWVIKRYRAYEALDQLNDPQPLPLAAVAQELGYFDQAHFANDFRSATGQAPSEYTAHAMRLKANAPAPQSTIRPSTGPATQTRT
jgi:AraC-like DNA-binding protein